MTLQQLRYAEKVSETENITQAARELFISQPSLTNAIRALEKEMHVTIFLRTNKGVTITEEGASFLAYARQVLQQADLLENRFQNPSSRKPRFSVSCQHYSFAVKAFADVVRKYDEDSYDFSLRETQTRGIISDVNRMISEIGILYLPSRNEEAVSRLIRNNNLDFEELITLRPHVFIRSSHPLADKPDLSLEDLADYPYLSYEQDEYRPSVNIDDHYNAMNWKKKISVRDRATLFGLLVELDGYTISSGLVAREWEGENIVAIPLRLDEYRRIGTVRLHGQPLSPYGRTYLAALRQHI